MLPDLVGSYLLDLLRIPKQHRKIIMITRRGFLKSILALGAAPAICKAENLMKIYVPKQGIFIPTGFGLMTWNPELKLINPSIRGNTKVIQHIDEVGYYDSLKELSNILSKDQIFTTQITLLLKERHAC